MVTTGDKGHPGASSSSRARWWMGKPYLLSLGAEEGAVSMVFFPIWPLLPQFHGKWDAWHSPAQVPLEVLAAVGKVKWVRTLRIDLALLTWMSSRYPPSAGGTSLGG